MEKQLFEFKGDWTFEQAAKKFMILNNSGSINFEIFDEFNDNPDPEIYQLNTVNYLLEENNQLNVLASIIEYSRNTIYPHYKTFMWESEYPECYPALNEITDLSKLFTLNSILIKRIQHDDYAYYVFNCYSCLDHEHGITLTLYKDKVLDHGEDWDDKKVCEHKGIDYKTYYDKAVQDYNHRELVITLPHPKYGKLKPWQKEQNEYFPMGLYHKNRLNDFQTELENKVFPKEPICSRVLELSILHEKEEFIKNLIERNVKFKYGAFKEALKKDRFDIMDKLLEQGYNINEKVAQSSHFYDTIGFMVSAIKSNEKYEKYAKRLNYLLENKLNPYLEDKWGRNSLFRIERIEDKELRSAVNTAVMHAINPKSNIFRRIRDKFKNK